MELDAKFLQMPNAAMLKIPPEIPGSGSRLLLLLLSSSLLWTFKNLQ